MIFSDHHKGARDGADDFAACEENYTAALGYYLESGYGLLLLGDVEELWESDPDKVLPAYDHVLRLEARFYEEEGRSAQSLSRYERFFGNHDDPWRHREQVAECLHRYYPGLEVREALKLRLVGAGSKLGTIFLVHGHQGTLDSDRFPWLSRWVVRGPWRFFQRRLAFRSVTPAKDFRLRAAHERAMFGWARDRRGERPVLVAGHTHRPVFMYASRPPDRTRSAEAIERELENRRCARDADPATLALLAAELELVRVAEERQGERRHRELPVPSGPPCYFNTGSCAFADGTVTGIELAEGEIRLVRWQTDEPSREISEPWQSTRAPESVSERARPVRKVLEREDLGDVLRAVAAYRPRAGSRFPMSRDC